jgi:hypothetical protein
MYFWSVCPHYYSFLPPFPTFKQFLKGLIILLSDMKLLSNNAVNYYYYTKATAGISLSFPLTSQGPFKNNNTFLSLHSDIETFLFLSY